MTHQQSNSSLLHKSFYSAAAATYWILRPPKCRSSHRLQRAALKPSLLNSISRKPPEPMCLRMGNPSATADFLTSLIARGWTWIVFAPRNYSHCYCCVATYFLHSSLTLSYFRAGLDSKLAAHRRKSAPSHCPAFSSLTIFGPVTDESTERTACLAPSTTSWRYVFLVTSLYFNT